MRFEPPLSDELSDTRWRDTHLTGSFCNRNPVHSDKSYSQKNLFTSRTINGHECAILFCPEVPLPYRDAYAFTKDGQVIQDRLLHWEAREPLNKAVPVPDSWEAHQCAHCETVVLVRCDTPETPVCNACRRMQTEKAVHEVEAVIYDIKKGETPFDVLSVNERADQLAQLAVLCGADDGAPNPIERQRIELENEQYHRELVMRCEAAEQEPERWDGLP